MIFDGADLCKLSNYFLQSYKQFEVDFSNVRLTIGLNDFIFNISFKDKIVRCNRYFQNMKFDKILMLFRTHFFAKHTLVLV